MTFSHRIARSLLAIGALPMALGACTMVGGVAGPPSVRPTTVRPPVETMRAPTGDAVPATESEAPPTAEHLTEAVVQVALESLGTPYEWGGTDANGFDCSGLIQFAYGRFGIRLPRTSVDQIRFGSEVALDPERLRAGDVLGFSGDRPGKTSHVGLYIGDDEFIHSSSSGVRVSTLSDPYWQASLVAARRIVE